jgi:hypothetical protein
MSIADALIPLLPLLDIKHLHSLKVPEEQGHGQNHLKTRFLDIISLTPKIP